LLNSAETLEVKMKIFLLVIAALLVSSCKELPSCKDMMDKCILDKAITLPPNQAGMQQAEQYCHAQKFQCR
jgi:hypothetical protein